METFFRSCILTKGICSQVSLNTSSPCSINTWLTFCLTSLICGQHLIKIIKSERIGKWILHFFTRPVNQISPIVVCQRNWSFDAPWYKRSWIDLFSKETQNSFLDFFRFKNPISTDCWTDHQPRCGLMAIDPVYWSTPSHKCVLYTGPLSSSYVSYYTS